jgi:hypothetical protein
VKKVILVSVIGMFVNMFVGQAEANPSCITNSTLTMVTGPNGPFSSVVVAEPGPPRTNIWPVFNNPPLGSGCTNNTGTTITLVLRNPSQDCNKQFTVATLVLNLSDGSNPTYMIVSTPGYSQETMQLLSDGNCGASVCLVQGTQCGPPQ